MAYYETKVWECACEKCGYVWNPRGEAKPKICPSCKSKLWNNEADSPILNSTHSTGVDLKPAGRAKKQPVASSESPNMIARGLDDLLKSSIGVVAQDKPSDVAPTGATWDGYTEERQAPDVEKGELVTYRQHLKTGKRVEIRRETEW